jgi:hypothetical protein
MREIAQEERNVAEDKNQFLLSARLGRIERSTGEIVSLKTAEVVEIDILGKEPLSQEHVDSIDHFYENLDATLSRFQEKIVNDFDEVFGAAMSFLRSRYPSDYVSFFGDLDYASTSAREGVWRKFALDCIRFEISPRGGMERVVLDMVADNFRWLLCFRIYVFDDSIEASLES